MNTLTIIIILSIIINAVADGIKIRAFKNKTKKYLGGLYHILYTLFIFSLLSLILTNNFLDSSMKYYIEHSQIKVLFYFVLSYSLIRYGIFDYIVNIFAGNHYLYIGDTAYIDRLHRKIFKTPNSYMFFILIKGISLIGGLYLIQHVNQLL